MAMIEYGSVVKKNGKIIQTEMFMDMKKELGFVINSIKQSYKETIFDEEYKRTPNHNDYKQRIDGNYFSYVGDLSLLVCVYKCGIVIIDNGKIIKKVENLDDNACLPYRRMSLEFKVKDVVFKLKRLNEESNRYKLRFIYKGDTYEILYGYGVDINSEIWYEPSRKERRYISKWFGGNK